MCFFEELSSVNSSSSPFLMFFVVDEGMVEGKLSQTVYTLLLSCKTASARLPTSVDWHMLSIFITSICGEITVAALYQTSTDWTF